MRLGDKEFAEWLAEGDEGAARMLVEKHHGSVFRFLRQLTRSADDAEDLAQQTMLRVMGAAHRFDERASFRAWVFAIAFNEFHRWRRRRLWLPISPDEPSTNNEIEQALNAWVLLDALSKISESQRALFLLHHVEMLSIEEIAHGLHIPEGTVKSRLFAARLRLQTLLREEDHHVTQPCQS